MVMNSLEANNQNQELVLRRSNLAQYIQSRAIIKSVETGYVSIEPVNCVVDPHILKEAAAITNGLFLKQLPPELQPQMVIGVPNRGREFATALGLETGLPIGVTERLVVSGVGDHTPWQKRDYEQRDIIIINGISSFTNPGEFHRHKIRGLQPDLQPGQTVLIADDFCAKANATNRYIEAFQELGIVPIFAYIVAKDFVDGKGNSQKGFREIRAGNQPAFAVVRLTGIQDGRVSVSSQDI